MSEFLRGLAGARRAREERELARRKIGSAELDDAAPLAARFRVGDRVRDPVTGLEGTVERVTFRHVVIPSP